MRWCVLCAFPAVLVPVIPARAVVVSSSSYSATAECPPRVSETYESGKTVTTGEARAADGEADAEERRDRGDRLLLMLVGFVPWVAAAELEVSVAGVREARFLAALMRTFTVDGIVSVSFPRSGHGFYQLK